MFVLSEYPHPIPSFRAPVPTLDSEPTDAPLVSVCFNYDWLPYVLGALMQLTLQSTWEGEDVELAMRRGDRLIQAFAAAYESTGCGTDKVPTPYWDDGSDVDDEADADEQIWYGVQEGDTFIEGVAHWVFGGLLASSGYPQAAVLYTTHEKAWRLAWLKGGQAGFARVVVDDALAALVDLFGTEGELIEMDFVGDPELSEHTILQIFEEVS